MCLVRPCDAARAKYALRHTVRTHLGSEDPAYLCMGAGEDAQVNPMTLTRFQTPEPATLNTTATLNEP